MLPNVSLARLAPREREAAELLGQGYNGPQIDAAMGITSGTRRIYVHRAIQALGVTSQTQVALIAQRERLTREMEAA